MQVNYKDLAERKLKEMMTLSEDYSLPEILYTVLRQKYLTKKPSHVDTRWLLDISDQEVYQALERACKDYSPKVEEIETDVINEL